jgi:ATP-dependent Clp protease ATP-binding subunit ClpA
VALTGSEVLVHANIAWPGCALPWRVTKAQVDLRPISSQALPDSKLQVADSKDQRGRMGKKARIAKRKLLAAERDEAEKKAQQEAERQITQKEKNARRNRKKQTKKREKEKLKKAGDTVVKNPS